MMAHKTLRILVGTAVALSVLVGFGASPAAAQSVPELPGAGDASLDLNVNASTNGIIIDLDAGPGSLHCELTTDAVPTEPSIPNASDSPCVGSFGGTTLPPEGGLPGGGLPGGGLPGIGLPV